MNLILKMQENRAKDTYKNYSLPVKHNASKHLDKHVMSELYKICIPHTSDINYSPCHT